MSRRPQRARGTATARTDHVGHRDLQPPCPLPTLDNQCAAAPDLNVVPNRASSVRQCCSASIGSCTGVSDGTQPCRALYVSTTCSTPAFVSASSSRCFCASSNPLSSIAPATYTRACITGASRCGPVSYTHLR